MAEDLIVDDKLHTALDSIIRQFGYVNVSKALRDFEPKSTARRPRPQAGKQRRTQRGLRKSPKPRLSAIDYVQRMDLPAEQAEFIGRAAEAFERRAFLPSVGDIRSFCETYGIEEPKSKSRVDGIPRIFKFLVTMQVADIQRMLDDRMFSGPAKLGPIADAIRGKAKEYREAAAERNSVADG